MQWKDVLHIICRIGRLRVLTCIRRYLSKDRDKLSAIVSNDRIKAVRLTCIGTDYRRGDTMRTDASRCTKDSISEMSLSFPIAEDTTSLLQRATRKFVLPIGANGEGTAGAFLNRSACHGHWRKLIVVIHVSATRCWLVQFTMQICDNAQFSQGSVSIIIKAYISDILCL